MIHPEASVLQHYLDDLQAVRRVRPPVADVG
jgi:hypothetical protein